MNTFLMIIITLLILTILVVVHEFGHYIIAKKFGVYIIEFAIGMGPKIFSRKGKETTFSIRAFPIGGFCRLLGEEEGNQEILKEYSVPDNLDDSRFYINKRKGEKILILVAGATMNFIFAFFLMFLVYIFKGIGFPAVLEKSLSSIGSFCIVIIQSFQMLFAGKLTLNDFAGPIGMVDMVGDFFQYGLLTLVVFIALISVNLGILNLLPFPALDGGQIFIVIVELIIQKELSPEKLGIINTIGFVVLLLLAVVIAVNDVFRLIQ